VFPAVAGEGGAPEERRVLDRGRECKSRRGNNGEKKEESRPSPSNRITFDTIAVVRFYPRGNPRRGAPGRVRVMKRFRMERVETLIEETSRSPQDRDSLSLSLSLSRARARCAPCYSLFRLSPTFGSGRTRRIMRDRDEKN